MFHRLLQSRLRNALARMPAVVLLGARQVGKTTLARQLAREAPDSLYLDLERPSDRARLVEPELFLREHRHQLVVLDEVQRAAEILPVLRSEIDDDRRPGRFLLLGSASPALLRESSESLAGRIATLDMQPLLGAEIEPGRDALLRLWTRGGFPDSYLADGDAASFAWRQDFIRTFLERDLPQFGMQISAPAIERLWRMLAHLHGQLFNASELARSLGVSAPTVARWIDLLEAARVVRRLEPLHANLGKRLVKSPKLYVADSGLVHALLGLTDSSALQGHPVVGASWEGFVLEQILGQLGAGTRPSFYRTAAGAELDVVVQRNGRTLAFEIKYSAAPKPTKGFWLALDDLKVDRAYVVAPVEDAYPLAAHVEVVPAHRLPELLAAT